MFCKYNVRIVTSHKLDMNAFCLNQMIVFVLNINRHRVRIRAL